MTALNSIELKIDEKAYSYARIYASLLNEQFQRKRAYASIVGLYALINLLETSGLPIQKSMTLFRNPILNEQYEISDVYVNDYHIEVRVVTEGNAFLLPKIHYDNNIAADYYAVIKIDTELKHAELIGFVPGQEAEKEAFDYYYYSCSFKNLISYEEFLKRVQTKKEFHFTDADHELLKNNYLGLMDGEIDKEIKNKIIKHLFECNDCRTEFCCFTGFEMVSCNFNKYPELIDDQTLNIIGAQAVDSEEYKEKEEESIYIGPDEQHPNGISEDNELYDAPEETVSDILDELFNTEDINETEKTHKEKPLNDITAVSEETSDLELIDNDNITNTDFEENNTVNDIDTSNNDNELVISDDDNELIELLPAENDELIEETKPDIISEENEDTQKVIVDYDEQGNPVYSYITNINEDFETSDDIETLPEVNDEEHVEEEINETYDETEVLRESAKEKLQEEDTQDIIETDTQNNITDEENITPINIAANILEPEESKWEEEDDTEENSDEIVFNNDDTTSEKEEIEYTETEASDGNDESDENDEYSEGDEEYEEYEEDDDEMEATSEYSTKPSNKGILAILILLVLIAMGGGAFFFMTKGQNTGNQIADNPPVEVQAPVENPANGNISDEGGIEITDNNPQDNIQNTDNSLEVPPQSEQSEISIDSQPNPVQNTGNENIAPPQPPQQQENNVSNIMTQAFTNGNGVSLKGVNWMCSPALYTEEAFKAYLQKLDDVLKMNLRNNLLNITEQAPNNTVTVKLAVDNNGNMLRSMIANSSGSDQIDNIVLQSINETIETEKTTILSNSAQKADKYFIQVVIKL